VRTIVLACLLAAWPAASHAITIISADGLGPPNTVGNNPTGFAIGTNINSGNEQYFAVGWTQNQSYTDVAITALLSGSFRGEARLTTAIGSGTTAADQVAAGLFMLDLDTDERTDIPLLSGLTLGPGTYFLTLEPGVGSSGNWWNEFDQSFVLDSGVSFEGLYQAATPGIDPAFIPASDFGLFFSSLSFTFAVTGEVATAVPEPATAQILAGTLAGLGALGWMRRRRPRIV
jgi:MYXO-CTERM domain-containing protein